MKKLMGILVMGLILMLSQSATAQWSPSGDYQRGYDDAEAEAQRRDFDAQMDRQREEHQHQFDEQQRESERQNADSERKWREIDRQNSRQ